MISRNSFTREFDGANSAYSNYMLIGPSMNEIIEAINSGAIVFDHHDPRHGFPQDNDYILGGDECKAPDGSIVVSFVIFGEYPDLINVFTDYFKCRGYADTDWDSTYTIASENGGNFEGYTADGEREERPGENDCFDMFVTITDPSGAVFETGAGAISEERCEYYEEMVRTH